MGLERRLAAILSADVVGYSRLMEKDEAGTLAHLSRQRKERIEPLIASHHGRIFKLMGDGILAEFASVVDAVTCAAAWQAGMAGEDLCFRIAVNLGDVIIEDGDIYGNGVNIASRLEALADPGGICLSGSVHGEVKNKLDLEFEDMGEHSLKNIAEPVRAYRIVLEGSGSAAPHTDAPQPGQAGIPTIAVLPFDNMSGDPGQEFFADGITEDIITALSHSDWFNVTARNSTFAYKGKSPDIRDVAKALGVNYVLEGSVRKGGDRARITVQLIDAATGNHVWADRYDRRTDDEFAVQDEISQRISSILAERIWQDIARNIGQKKVEDYGSHDYAYRGIELLHRLEPDAVTQAEGYLQKALDLDPELITGHLGLGFCYMLRLFWGDPVGTRIEKAFGHAMKLLKIAPNDAHTYRLLSRIYAAKHMHEESWSCVERALRIDPNDGDIIGNRAIYHLFQGEFDTAIEWFDKVLDMHQDTPHTADIMRYWKALAMFSTKDYAASAALLAGITGMEFLKAELLAPCCARLGQDDRARANANEVVRMHPEFSLSHVGLWKSFRHEADRLHLFDAMRDAGLPA
jgi:adenylate cyclase